MVDRERAWLAGSIVRGTESPCERVHPGSVECAGGARDHIFARFGRRDCLDQRRVDLPRVLRIRPGKGGKIVAGAPGARGKATRERLILAPFSRTSIPAYRRAALDDPTKHDHNVVTTGLVSAQGHEPWTPSSRVSGSTLAVCAFPLA